MTADIGIAIAAILTIAIFSLLYRDNPLYRAAEHLLVGISAGYYLVNFFSAAVMRKFLFPVFKQGNLWLIPGGILGLIVLLRAFRRTQWISRYAIAFYVAAWSGYLIPSVVKERILVQIASTIPPAPWQPHAYVTLLDFVGAITLLVGVASILVYFYFSAPHTGVLGGISRVGIVFLMVGFGATFGYTVMGRVSLLIGRFQFLLRDVPAALFGP